MTSRIWARTGNLSYRYVAEDIGIEPNTLTGTSRLAGGPYRHQGLSSFVFTTGYDPITSDVSDRRSTNWATWTYADRENYDISTSTLTGFCSASELPVLLLFGGSGRGRTYTPFGLDLQSSEPAKCSTLPYFLYTLQGSNLWPIVCKTIATTIWAKSV